MRNITRWTVTATACGVTIFLGLCAIAVTGRAAWDYVTAACRNST